MTNTFAKHVFSFFEEYLSKTKGVSLNTISSYKSTILQLLNYLQDVCKVDISTISATTFEKDIINGFLIYLEREKHIKESTRNQKLAAIHSLFHYIQKRDLSYFNVSTQILQIEYKRVPKPIVSYLSIEEMEILFSVPNINKKKDLRELAILVFLYETGARVQELIDCKVQQITISSTSMVELHGKGKKARLVPIGKKVAKILKAYINAYKLGPNDNLFLNKYNEPFTRVGVQYIINKNIHIAKKCHPNLFNQKIHNHSFRHSKAMHLLESGVNLVYIRDFLGHESITVTEVYAKANPEVKRKVIENNATKINIKSRYSNKEKDDLISWLMKK